MRIDTHWQDMLLLRIFCAGGVALGTGQRRVAVSFAVMLTGSLVQPLPDREDFQSGIPIL